MSKAVMREQVQPYFRCFMIERGYVCASEADNHDYMKWNQRRWIEFYRSIGLKERPVSSKPYWSEFAGWLERRAQCLLAAEQERDVDREAQDWVEGRHTTLASLTGAA